MAISPGRRPSRNGNFPPNRSRAPTAARITPVKQKPSAEFARGVHRRHYPTSAMTGAERALWARNMRRRESEHSPDRSRSLRAVRGRRRSSRSRTRRFPERRSRACNCSGCWCRSRGEWCRRAALAGSVAPMVSRQRAMAPSASSTITMILPELMNVGEFAEEAALAMHGVEAFGFAPA